MRSTPTGAVLVLGLALGLLPCAGCRREATLPPPSQVHTVRGRVVQLPEPGKPANSFQVHHEPIEHWVSPTGKVGMNAMVMSFLPAPGLALDGLEVGDVIEFRWEVRERSAGPSYVTSITELPKDTPLNLGKAGGG